MVPTKIRDATPADFDAIAAVYNHYIANTVVTFELEPVTPEEIGRRIETVTRDNPWLVLETGEGVVGYAYASRWHARAAYRHTLETSVYLSPAACGNGHGRRLYDELLRRLEGRGVHVLMAGIALPNAASVTLHERLGFVKAAHYTEVGYKFDRWIDVGYWQKTLTNPIEHA
ncbi:Phosphinothricin N-acetyltransferase [Posidoniimonas polymericola]|uniref:Phosphinothricin N-acetyltransferase n=1 Tax=Posidoniimonas polymericola TaxID=2528002 RepID=A0A5C5YQ31_9BACT|nr:arsinothricin resistance N-acetyltransferase ArsN1 family B [Posidoniimonas polymericola]TWT76898.1 Phosphinothricin N-acetyltransferase [Posidoniimonas polymericola]